MVFTLFGRTRFRIFNQAGCKHSLHPFPVALCAWAFLTTGCVQPLGPGYHFAVRQTAIRPSAASPEQLQVRVVDHFDNVGNLPLRSLEVHLPEGSNYGSQNMRVTIDGKEVSPEHSSNADQQMMRASLDPEWERPRSHEIVTEWSVMPWPPAQGAVAAPAAAFYIADETALPLWQPPASFFTQAGPIPDKEILTVFTPPDFHVLAPGKLLKRIPAENLLAQRFHINPEEDFLPYVVAGRYQEQVIRTSQGAVSFWTFQSLDAQQARTAATRLSSSMRALENFFGPVSRGKTVVHIVEAPGELPAEFGVVNNSDSGGIHASPEAFSARVETTPGGTSFPNGVLLDSRPFSQGVANEAVLQLAEYELGRTWFGWRVRPRPEAQILMGRGVGLFGLVVAAEARGQDQRGLAVASLLERYDQARHIAEDGPLIEPPGGYSLAERISTGYRGALFLVALEDLSGHANMSAAFHEIVQARANDDVGYEELRAALESASGRDLAEMFRAWLIRAGIPDDFRARYSKAPSAR